MKRLFLLAFLFVSFIIDGRDKGRLEDNGPLPVVFTPCPAVKKQIMKDWAPTLLSSLGLISYYILYRPSLKNIYSTTRSTLATSPNLLTFSLGLGIGAWVYDYYKPRLIRIMRYCRG